MTIKSIFIILISALFHYFVPIGYFQTFFSRFLHFPFDGHIISFAPIDALFVLLFNSYARDTASPLRRTKTFQPSQWIFGFVQYRRLKLQPITLN